MKKIIIAALLIAAISLVTTACGDKEEPTNKEEKKKAAINISSDSLNYTTKNIQEFSYEVPENWRETPLNRYTNLFLSRRRNAYDSI